MTTRRAALLALALGLAILPGCPASVDTQNDEAAKAEAADVDSIAREYVKLVLAVGEHDPDYVDAWFGSEEIRDAVRAEGAGLDTIRARATDLLGRLGAGPAGEEEEILRLRHEYLRKQLGALVARVDILGGATMTFDEESRALYDAVAPTHPDQHFQAVLDDLETLLPGEGPLVARYDAFRKGYVIPGERLDDVFQAAIEACRRRTREHLDLPPDESFTVEYVRDEPWGAYNWYQGGFRSLIQVNTDLPIYIDRAVDLACHEGYPGHHAYNVLLERHLTRGRGWVEFTVYPLFSPQSLIAEGTANFGIEMAFPGEERVAFEKETLFPLAGLDPATAEIYYRVQKKMEDLSYAGNEAARRYLDGRIDRDEAVEWLARYALSPRERAAKRIRFIDRYRSYVINYNLGKDLVRDYIQARAGEDPERRWEKFGRLLSSPRLPSGLR